jgi:hypothetical protein
MMKYQTEILYITEGIHYLPSNLLPKSLLRQYFRSEFDFHPDEKIPPTL